MHFLVVSSKVFQCGCMYACFFPIHTIECAKKYFSHASECILVHSELMDFAELTEEITVLVLKYIYCIMKTNKGKIK